MTARCFFPGFIPVLGVIGLLAPARGSDIGEQVVTQLFAARTNAAMSIAAGNFVYEDSGQLSSFSSLLGGQIEKALAKQTGIEVVSHDRLAELQIKSTSPGGQAQGALPLDPGDAARPMRIEGVQALVRGRYYLQPSNVVVQAEIVMLETAKIAFKAEVRMSQEEVSAQWRLTGGEMTPRNDEGGGRPAFAPLRMMPEMIPFNFWAGETNIMDVAYRLDTVPHEFGMDVVVEECKRRFAGGEIIHYRIRPEMSCHVAVFDHGADGSTVLLFPNAYQTNTWLQGGAYADIPGYQRDGFCLRIGKPFGADVIQVIACTDRSALHRKMEQAAQATSTSVALASVPRRTVAEEVRGIRPDPEAKVKWAGAQLVLSTYPGPTQ